MSPAGRYDPGWVSRYYDAYGEREWKRWDRSPEDRVKLHVHRHYLERFVQSGQTVLEIGAGSGRFTQVLAELGARILVADLSKGQLALNRANAAAYGYGRNVIDWIAMDACDMGSLASSRFDAVVAYGGLIGFVFENRNRVMTELLRVLKSGGPLLMSVMSVWGSFHSDLPFVLSIPREQNESIIDSGDLHPDTFSTPNQRVHMFRAEELESFLADHPVRLEAISASNSLTAGCGDGLSSIESDEAKWRYLLEKEIVASSASGCLDIGTHIIAVVRKL